MRLVFLIAGFCSMALGSIQERGYQGQSKSYGLNRKRYSRKDNSREEISTNDDDDRKYVGLKSAPGSNLTRLEPKSSGDNNKRNYRLTNLSSRSSQDDGDYQDGYFSDQNKNYYRYDKSKGFVPYYDSKDDTNRSVVYNWVTLPFIPNNHVGDYLNKNKWTFHRFESDSDRNRFKRRDQDESSYKTGYLADRDSKRNERGVIYTGSSLKDR